MPTAIDLRLFALLAPILAVPRGTWTAAASGSGSTGTSRRVVGGSFGAVLAALLRGELDAKGEGMQRIIRSVFAVAQQVWPSSSLAVDAVGGEGGWRMEETLARDTIRQSAAVASAGNRSRASRSGTAGGGGAEEQEESATVSKLASVLVLSAATSVSNAFAPLTSVFQSSPINNSARDRNDSANGAGTGAGGPTSAAEAHLQREEIRKITSRRRWWIAGSVLAVVGYVFATGMISIQFVEDDDDELQEAEEALEAEVAAELESGMRFARTERAGGGDGHAEELDMENVDVDVNPYDPDLEYGEDDAEEEEEEFMDDDPLEDDDNEVDYDD